MQNKFQTSDVQSKIILDLCKNMLFCNTRKITTFWSVTDDPVLADNL